MTKWTVDQEKAIVLEDKDILVAAAAGSGKTAVLVERIIQNLTNPQNPLSILNLLVVTFTNAAAAEMRSRIGTALSKKLRETKDPKQKVLLEEQLILLSGASISTLHSFCQDLIRQHIHLLGWAPNFRLLNDPEATLLKEDVLDQILEYYYSLEDPQFFRLADIYGNAADDQGLRKIILSFYDLSLSHPWPQEWIRRLSTDIQRAPEEDFGETPWGRILFSYAARTLESAQASLFSLKNEAVRRNRNYGTTFDQDEETLRSLRGALGLRWDTFVNEVASYKFQTATWGVSKDAPLPEIEDKLFFEEERNGIKSQIEKLKIYFTRSSSDLLNDIQKTVPELALLGEITLAFSNAYGSAKLSEGLADFSDLEHGALTLLRDFQASPNQPFHPSEVAKELRSRYKEVMIDEYQDTNGVQEELLSLLCDQGGACRFQVGDVKQSIYKFRLAEPELFLEKYRSYPDEEQAELIHLNQNFRSRENVLEGINFICKQLFHPTGTELEYGESESLKPGASFPAETSKTLAGPIEVHLLEKSKEDNESDSDLWIEDSEFRKEVHLAAQILQKWQREKKQVFDKKAQSYRDFRWSDAVILLRSVRGRTPDLLEILRSYEIPCHADIDEGYFAETEIQILLSMLQIIDNPYQDIPLAAVLRSPIGSFSEPDLAQIRLINEKGLFWEALQEGMDSPNLSEDLKEKIKAFLLLYHSSLEFSRRESVAALIRKILADTLYDSWVTALSGGSLRAANLQALQQRAKEFENTGMRGLSRFLRFIQKIQEKGSDWGPARLLGEQENLVRILSIHKSKGLEFPAVFLLNIGKKFNLQDQRDPILFHKTLGAGLFVTDLDLRYRYPTGIRNSIKVAVEQENKAEELRILYVAMTRAEEKLVLIGSSPSLAKRIAHHALQSSYHMEDVLLPGVILEKNSYLDWIFLALARHQDTEEVLTSYGATKPIEFLHSSSSWKLFIHQKVENVQNQQAKQFPEKNFLNHLTPLPTENFELPTDFSSFLTWQYAQENTVGIPAKTSVTELKRRAEWLEEEQWLPILPRRQSLSDRPRFMQEISGLTPTEKGTQLHSLMQNIDFQKIASLDDLDKQVQRLVEKKLLSDVGLQDLPLKAIFSLIQSPLGERIKHGICHRELPCSSLIPGEKLLPQWKNIKDSILIQGVVDLLIEEEQGYLLLDYKSDKAATQDYFLKNYSHQLFLYRDALQPILKKPILEIWIYSFHLSKEIRLH